MLSAYEFLWFLANTSFIWERQLWKSVYSYSCLSSQLLSVYTGHQGAVPLSPDHWAPGPLEPNLSTGVGMGWRGDVKLSCPDPTEKLGSFCLFVIWTKPKNILTRNMSQFFNSLQYLDTVWKLKLYPVWQAMYNNRDASSQIHPSWWNCKCLRIQA